MSYNLSQKLSIEHKFDWVYQDNMNLHILNNYLVMQINNLHNLDLWIDIFSKSLLENLSLENTFMDMRNNLLG